MRRRFRVSQSEDGVRADIFVTKKFPQFSRSALKNLFTQEQVLANRSALKAGDKLRAGKYLTVSDELIRTEPEPIKLPVIYEDSDVVVIDKPTGVLTHSKGALNLESTVASFIKPLLNDPELQGNRAGIVHRLDRHTSGLLIAAKNAAALAKLQKQFSTRKVKKVYTAVVERVPSKAEALIDAPIQRNPKKPQTFRVNSQGKPAQTQYHLQKTFTKNAKQYSVLELRPITGRTHQIRVHLAYIGHPVVGDSLYGKNQTHNLLLHASSLELTLPSSERKTFTSKLPKRFKDFIEK